MEGRVRFSRRRQRSDSLNLARLWQAKENPHQVFFLVDVESIAKVQALVIDPGAKQAGRGSGVREGAYDFLKEIGRD